MSFFFKFFNKEKKEDFDKGLEKIKFFFFGKIGKVIVGKIIVDEEVFDELESIFIFFDVGLDIIVKIIECIEVCVVCDKYFSISELNEILWDEIVQFFVENNIIDFEFYSLFIIDFFVIIFVVGVNGVGKMIIIGKFVYQYKK